MKVTHVTDHACSWSEASELEEHEGRRATSPHSVPGNGGSPRWTRDRNWRPAGVGASRGRTSSLKRRPVVKAPHLRQNEYAPREYTGCDPCTPGTLPATATATPLSLARRGSVASWLTTATKRVEDKLRAPLARPRELWFAEKALAPLCWGTTAAAFVDPARKARWTCGTQTSGADKSPA